METYITIKNLNTNLLANKTYQEGIKYDIILAEQVLTKLNTSRTNFIHQFESNIDKIKQDMTRSSKNNKSAAFKLKVQSCLLIAGNVVGFISSAISIFGPAAAVFGAVGKVGGSVIEGIAGSFGNDEMKVLGVCSFTDELEFEFDDLKGTTINVERSNIVPLLTNVNEIISTPTNKIDITKLNDNLKENSAEILTEALQKLKDELVILESTFTGASGVTAAVTDSFTPAVNTLGEKVWESIAPIKRDPAQPTQDANVADTNKKITAKNILNAKKIERMKKVMKAVEAGCQFVGLLKTSLTARNAIKTTDAEAERFEQASKEVTQFMNETFKKLINGMKSMDKSFSEASSRSVLDFLRYNMKNSIKKVLNYFRIVFKDYDFENKDEFFSLFDELDNVSETIATIYGRIFEGIDKLKLAQLITAVSSNTNISSDYKVRFTELEKLSEAILISQDGKNILETSNQIFFPCSIDYQTDFKVIFHENGINTATSSALDKVKKASSYVDTVINNIKILRDKHQVSINGITKYSTYVIADATFNTTTMDPTHLGSFFIYRNPYKIQRLLKGEKIYVFADATATGPEYSYNAEGVKFNSQYCA